MTTTNITSRTQFTTQTRPTTMPPLSILSLNITDVSEETLTISWVVPNFIDEQNEYVLYYDICLRQCSNPTSPPPKCRRIIQLEGNFTTLRIENLKGNTSYTLFVNATSSTKRIYYSNGTITTTLVYRKLNFATVFCTFFSLVKKHTYIYSCSIYSLSYTFAANY